jgi:hypothetical protein
VDQLVPERYRPTLRYRTAENLHWAPMSELYWVGGAAALVDNEMTDSILLMREGTAHPGRFSSLSDAGHVRLTLRGAEGTTDPTTASLPIATNRRGLTLVEWNGPAAGIERIDIRPAEHDALLRLDSLEVVATSPDGVASTWFRWEGGDPPEALLAAGVWWVAPGVMAVDANSVVTVDLAGPASSGELRVMLAAAYLPAVPGSIAGAGGELESTRRELAALYDTWLFRVADRPRRLYGALRRRILRR